MAIFVLLKTFKIGLNLYFLLIIGGLSFFSLDIEAQSSFEQMLERELELKYVNPVALQKTYVDLFSGKKTLSPKQLNTVKVYLALCYDEQMKHAQAKSLFEEISFFEMEDESFGRWRYQYLKAAIRFNDREYKEARKIIRSSLVEAAKMESSKLLVDGYYLAGRIEQKAGSSDSAILYFKRSLEIAHKNNLTPQEALAIRQLGYHDYFNRADFFAAKKKYIKSLDLSREHKLAMISAETYRSLGIIYVAHQKKDSSVYCVKTSLEFYDSLKISGGVIGCYISLGNIFYGVYNREQAIAYLRRAETLAIKARREDYLPVIYNNWGAIIPVDQIEERKSYFIKCIKKSNEFKNVRLASFGYLNLGEVYVKEKNFLAAQKELNNARQAMVELKSTSNLLVLNRVFVDFHMAWREYNPKEFAKFAKPMDYEKLLAEAEASFESNNNYSELQNVFDTYIKFYKNKDLKKVNRYQARSLALKDSVITLNSTKAAYTYLEDVKTAEKEKEILRLESERKISDLQRKLLLVGSGLMMLLFVGLMYFIIQRIKKRNKRMQEERTLALRHKLSSDLHDEVGTTLTGLAMHAESLAMSDTPSKKGIVKVAALSRRAMVTMRDTVWAIDSRKDCVKDLVYRMLDFVESVFENSEIKTDVKYQLADEERELTAELRQSVYLFFKEAMTNVLKHSNGNLVKVFLEQKEDVLSLRVHDNGKATVNFKKSGLGLDSMRERVESFKGEFSIDSSDGFAVNAKFPI